MAIKLVKKEIQVPGNLKNEVSQMWEIEDPEGNVIFTKIRYKPAFKHLAEPLPTEETIQEKLDKIIAHLGI
jgi:hypothetical protein